MIWRKHIWFYGEKNPTQGENNERKGGSMADAYGMPTLNNIKVKAKDGDGNRMAKEEGHVW